jgi:hypothetical protein
MMAGAGLLASVFPAAPGSLGSIGPDGPPFPTASQGFEGIPGAAVGFVGMRLHRMSEDTRFARARFAPLSRRAACCRAELRSISEWPNPS